MSVLLGFTSLYLMFIKAENDIELAGGFGVMLLSIIFILFMFLEERNEEISKLKHTILKMKGII